MIVYEIATFVYLMGGVLFLLVTNLIYILTNLCIIS